MTLLRVDRIENNTAVLENGGRFVNTDISLLPDGIKEGDILIRYKNGKYKYDKKRTRARKEELLKKQNSLFEKKENGK
ncbi:MAG: DUF3006 domain-containing protein [Ruminococcaceae bacterium]|nr:DUF3006 domain-containing protein [Oscillospiraceae bacterium]